MGLSTPSEQVAYLLVERATLLERLEAAERRMDSHSLSDNLREVHLQHLKDSSQERLALLEACLTEEKEWRKQLEVDLSAAQAALKKDKEVAQMEYAHCQLQSEAECYMDSDWTQENLQQNQLQVDQLQERKRLEPKGQLHLQRSSTKEALSSNQKSELLTAHAESTLNSVERTKDQCLDQRELNHLQAKLGEERQLVSQHQLAPQTQINKGQARIKRCAELNQVQTKLVQLEQSVHIQTAYSEHHQQRIRELELACNSTNRSTTTSLREDLQVERTQLIAADKKVLELQQQLKNAQHQLRMEKARAGESNRLERDSRDLSDNLSALRAQQQEEHITRKLLKQWEELQQQVRSLRLKEGSLTRTNAELSHCAQQLDTRLSTLEAELNKTKEEARDSQTSSHGLKEELAASQQEYDRLQAELQQVHLQLDKHIRKYNEKKSRHKTKLRQVKQAFHKATTQRDSTIQKLETDQVLASSLINKEKERVRKVVEANEKLLKEKRVLSLKISEAEEMGSNGMKAASTAQHRVHILDVENRQLQDQTMKLSNQVSFLERVLRNVQSFYSLENAKKVLPSESLSDGILHTSTLSLSSGLCKPLDILDANNCVKVGDRAVVDSTVASVSTHEPSEQDYLNLISQLVPPDTKGTEGNANTSDETGDKNLNKG
ncbi:coiled-coil domain-containing protein 30-like isoform X3 [Scomber scombrus]|uniref:Coiled-coil domain-containing protein 30-like isoform X3 n=1 Tax=Scomber scombrus TaxID=13677 RepID=A0AAV1MWF9_SCOSC